MAGDARRILVHVHGIGELDFSSLGPSDLPAVESMAAARGICLVPTIYLRRAYLLQFEQVMREFARLRSAGEVPHIVGFAMEGPCLGPEGGTPREGTWTPTADEWRRIAALGENGLVYVVMAPDAMQLHESIAPGLRFRDLVESVYDHGGRLALGHFRREDPHRSADLCTEVIEYIQSRCANAPEAILTDHLFNDMPRNFHHAFRGTAALVDRQAEIDRVLGEPWSEDSIDDLLGEVPALLLKSALNGRLTPCLNFDGAHVDLAFCERTVRFLDSSRLMAITDSVEIDVLAGEVLSRRADTTLRYREDGVVAAGSCDIDRQTSHMRDLGLAECDIENLWTNVPTRVLAYDVRGAGVR